MVEMRAAGGSFRGIAAEVTAAGHQISHVSVKNIIEAAKDQGRVAPRPD